MCLGVGGKNKMKDIQVKIKPDNLSFDCICEVIAKAHSTLEEDGVGKLTTTGISAEELQERLGPYGACFVAMDGEKLAGTGSIIFSKRNEWFCKGYMATFGFLAILPEYRRLGIAAKLIEARKEFVKQNGIEVIVCSTNAKNIASINLQQKQGFKLVSFYWTKNRYIVRMAYWLNGCPYSTFTCNMRFNSSKMKTKLKCALKIFSK